MVRDVTTIFYAKSRRVKSEIEKSQQAECVESYGGMGPLFQSPCMRSHERRLYFVMLFFQSQISQKTVIKMTHEKVVPFISAFFGGAHFVRRAPNPGKKLQLEVPLPVFL